MLETQAVAAANTEAHTAVPEVDRTGAGSALPSHLPATRDDCPHDDVGTSKQAPRQTVVMCPQDDVRHLYAAVFSHSSRHTRLFLLHGNVH